MQISLAKDKTYLLACSYGPDSMVLFDLLLRGGYSFKVAHVNYMMRKTESEAETTALLAYAKAHNIECFTKHVNGKELSGNFQTKAREVRYDFFAKIINEQKLDALLTAHHADDLLETFLMQKTSKRKTFYYGIKAHTKINNLDVYRPLLPFSKDDIFEYAKSFNVPFSIDSSNNETHYTRNKIRHKVLKNIDYAGKMALFAEINTLNAKIELLEQELKNYIHDNSISVENLLKLNHEEAQFLLALLFASIDANHLFNPRRAEHIIDVAKSSKTSLMHRIKDDIYLVKFEEKIALINVNNFKPYTYKVSQLETLKTPHFIANFASVKALSIISESAYPLTITNATSKDTYQVKNYTKKLNRLYIDMKLPRHYRLIWPVVKNKDGKVIYVPRYRRDYKHKETDLFEIFTISNPKG